MSNILKKIVVLLVAILSGSPSYTQTYQPFPTENALWREKSGGYQSGNCKDYHYIITGDTIVNSHTYSKLQMTGVQYYEDNQGYCTSQVWLTFNAYKGAFRNDSANKKVYFLPEGSDEDTLFYNFDLSIGQVLPPAYGYYSWDGSVHMVNEIDSILIEDTYHKRYYLADTAYPSYDYVELIEGLGTSFGLFGDLTFPFERFQLLLCYKRNGYTVYPFVGYPCNLVTSIDDNECNGKVIQAYPNPFSTSTTIEYQLEKISSIQFTIYNSMGVEVFFADEGMMHPGPHKVSWSPPPHIPAGLYYAVLRSEDGVSVVKMVKQ